MVFMFYIDYIALQFRWRDVDNGDGNFFWNIVNIF